MKVRTSNMYTLVSGAFEELKESFDLFNALYVSFYADPVISADQVDVKQMFDLIKIAYITCTQLIEQAWTGKLYGFGRHRLNKDRSLSKHLDVTAILFSFFNVCMQAFPHRIHGIW